jgi:hypothetical protein
MTSLRTGTALLSLAPLLFACGGDEEPAPADTSPVPPGATEPEGRPVPAPAAPSAREGDVLEHLTAEQLDGFVAILEEAAASPDVTAPQVALGRGWNVGTYTELRARTISIVEAGGYDEMLDRTRERLARSEAQLAELRTAAEQGGAGADFAAQGIPALEGGVTAMNKTLENAEAMRPGGELVEARIALLEPLL